MAWIVGNQPCRKRTWAELRANVSSLISVLTKRPDHFIVLASEKPKRFVQFDSFRGRKVRAEAVSNHFLESKERLNATTQRTMRELGWKRPGGADSLHPNYWKAWHHPVPSDDLALLAVRTLNEAFGIEKPTKIRITCDKFTDESDSDLSKHKPAISILWRRKPLRTPDPPVDVRDGMFLYLGGRRGFCVDYDWKEWRIVGHSLRKIVRKRGFIGKLPSCGPRKDFDVWLEELNYLIGQKANFVDGRSYHLLDLLPGHDSYTILFCPKRYKIPKWAMWSEEKEESALTEYDNPSEKSSPRR